MAKRKNQLDEKRLIKEIEQQLKENNLTIGASENILIENLIVNLKLIIEALRDIDARGQMVNLRKSDDEPYYQINFSISIYQNAIKQVQSILRQLGIDPASRLKNLQVQSGDFDLNGLSV